ncbi:MAG: 50S ribosomal protein L6 [Bacteroidia bacterium]|nr:50S ribosomal protein L6 [Bacteroidia bacterium]
MSRIGNKIIEIPAGVTVSQDKHVVTVKGPKGELKQELKEGFDLKIDGNQIQLIRPSDEKQDKALHGLYRSLIHNHVVGVSHGHTISQEFVGVGYRATVQGQVLDMSIGYSHKIMFELPKEIKIKAEAPKGAAPFITMECIDKELLGRVAAKIRSFRPPEPYKGKGIRYVGEQVRRKAGKSAAKK